MAPRERRGVPADVQQARAHEGAIWSVIVGEGERYYVRGRRLEKVQARAMRAARDDGQPTIVRSTFGPLYGDERPGEDETVLDADEWQPKMAVPRGTLTNISAHASANLENIRQGRDEGHLSDEHYRERARDYLTDEGDQP